jgi:hypothetical protein
MGGYPDDGLGREIQRADPATQRQKAHDSARRCDLHHEIAQAEHDAEPWQAAMEALLLVAEHDGPTMFARIGVMRALNRHVERVFNPSRKDTRWGRRPLARDR